eukprot:Amastigsp_a514539_140.p2 type:complete len:254 gc:universal Amastigsp_a514539_140:936-1697(+)
MGAFVESRMCSRGNDDLWRGDAKERCGAVAVALHRHDERLCAPCGHRAAHLVVAAEHGCRHANDFGFELSKPGEKRRVKRVRVRKALVREHCCFRDLEPLLVVYSAESFARGVLRLAALEHADDLGELVDREPFRGNLAELLDALGHGVLANDVALNVVEDLLLLLRDSASGARDVLAQELDRRGNETTTVLGACEQRHQSPQDEAENHVAQHEALGKVGPALLCQPELGDRRIHQLAKLSKNQRRRWQQVTS